MGMHFPRMEKLDLLYWKMTCFFPATLLYGAYCEIWMKQISN